MSVVLQVDTLSKRIGSRIPVDQISFAIRAPPRRIGVAAYVWSPGRSTRKRLRSIASLRWAIGMR